MGWLILIGLISLILLIDISSLEMTREHGWIIQQEELGDMYECPHCGRVTSVPHRCCPYCGKRVR